jgi:HK97 family phage major capsid protein
MMKKERRRLFDRAAAIVKERKALDVSTPEGETQDQTLAKEFDTLQTAIRRCDELIAAEEALQPPPLPAGPPAAVSDDPLLGNSPLRPTVPAQARDSRPFRRFGEQLAAIVQAGTPGGLVDQRLLDVNAAISGGAATSPSDGGFLIQTDFAQEIFRRTYDSGILASRCQRVPISDNADTLEVPYLAESSRAAGSRWGGVRVYRTGEAVEATATKPTMGRFKLELEDLTGLAYATDRLLRDAPAMEAIYREAFANEFAFVLDDEIFRGTGVGQCLGVLNADCTVSQAKETGQTATTIVYENVVNMWSRLWGRSRANSIWVINQDCEPQLAMMAIPVGTGGLPVYLPPSGASQSPYSTLFGRPVIPIETCSTLGTVGDIALLDLSQYVLIEKDGLQADSSIHVRFIYHETTFRFLMRINGKPKWASKLTPYKGSNTQSPFITLATRA